MNTVKETTLHPDGNDGVDLYPKTNINQVEGLKEKIKNLEDFDTHLDLTKLTKPVRPSVDSIVTFSDSEVVGTTPINQFINKPITPTADSVITMLANGSIGTKPLSDIGGKLYKHIINIAFSEITKIRNAYITLVDNYDKSYDIDKLNATYFNNGTEYLICRIFKGDAEGVGNITYYSNGSFAYVSGVFASGSGGGNSVLTGINEAPLFISNLSDTVTEL